MLYPFNGGCCSVEHRPSWRAAELLALETSSGNGHEGRKKGTRGTGKHPRVSSSYLQRQILRCYRRKVANSQEELQPIPKESIEELIRVDGLAISGSRKWAETQDGGGGDYGEPWSDGPWLKEEPSDALRARVVAAADRSPRMKGLYDGDLSNLQDQSRSGAAMAMARHLYNAGFGIEEIVPLLRSLSETADWIAEKDADPTRRELKRLWATIRKEPRKRRRDGSEFGTVEIAPRRRTGATMLGDMGELPDLVEAPLNHVSIRTLLAAAHNRSQVTAALPRLADALDEIAP